MEGEISVEDSLRDAMKEVSAQSSGETETEVSKTETKVEKVETPEPKRETVEPKREIKPAKVEKVADEEEIEGEATAAAAPQVAPEESDYEPPKFLSADERPEFDKLPKESKPLVDRFLRRRDLAMQRWVSKVRQEANQQISEQLSPYSGLQQVLMPHLQRMRLSNKDIAATLDSTLEWDRLIDENPVDALSQLCARKGITPRQLYDYMQGNGTSVEAVSRSGSQFSEGDNELRGLVTSLRAELDTLKEGSVKSQWTGVVSQLAAARDEQGNPAYPYFEDVRPEMAAWTRTLGEQHPEYSPAELFKAAYEKAVWSNDSIRAILLNERRAISAASSIAKKRAAGSLPASSNGIAAKSKETPLSENASIEQSILSAMEQNGIEF